MLIIVVTHAYFRRHTCSHVSSTLIVTFESRRKMRLCIHPIPMDSDNGRIRVRITNGRENIFVFLSIPRSLSLIHFGPSLVRLNAYKRHDVKEKKCRCFSVYQENKRCVFFTTVDTSPFNVYYNPQRPLSPSLMERKRSSSDVL